MKQASKRMLRRMSDSSKLPLDTPYVHTCPRTGVVALKSLNVSRCCLQRVSQFRQLAYLHELEKRELNRLGLEVPIPWA